MKIGKQLKDTNYTEKLNLLLNKEVFLTGTGQLIYYSQYHFLKSEPPFRITTEPYKVLGQETCPLNTTQFKWFYPAKTYFIGNVELEDLRLTFAACPSAGKVYVADPTYEKLCFSIEVECSDEGNLRLMCERNLVHKTEEAAITHARTTMNQVRL